jgi:hypothetical protein
MIVHIEKYHANEFGEDEDSRSIAECGAIGILKPNGETIPEGYNFYLQPAGYKSDCIPCLQAYLKRLLDQA